MKQWTVPRRPSGEFDEVAGTRRLLDILDEDRNGKVDAREIIDALHSHPNKEEIVSLLRLHPNPEKALGIAKADAEDEVALAAGEANIAGPPTPTDHKGRKGHHKFASLKLELEHAKGTLAAHKANQKVTGAQKKQSRRRLSMSDRNTILIEALDTDKNGHVDAHELITMIREHPNADKLIDMVSKMPDPKFSLGVVKAPSKYRRRSLLVKELNDAKKHLHHTRKRVSTLQTNKIDAQALRDQLVAFKHQHEQLKKGSKQLKDSNVDLSLMDEDVAEESGDSDTSSSRDSDGDQEPVLITRNTVTTGNDGIATSTERDTPATRTSALEITLRKHTEDISQQIRKLPGLAGDTWGGTTSAGPRDPRVPSDRDLLPSALEQLLSPSNHVFIGLWHRTKSTLGAWPLCLCASLATGELSGNVKVGLGNYDHSSGVVWRFVEASSLDASRSQANRQTDSGQSNSEEDRGTIRTFIECVDHYDFHNRKDPAVQKRRLFLTSELTLISDFTQAAAWSVTLHEHGNFRDGPGDVSVQISLADWGARGKMMGHGTHSDSSSSSRRGGGPRNSRGIGTKIEMVLCAKSATKEVVLVSSSELGKSDPKTGLFLYDVAWELTPDAEAPIREGMGTEDMIPLENYLDGRFLDVVY